MMRRTSLHAVGAALLLMLACQAPEAQGKPPPPAAPPSTDVTAKDYAMPPLPRAFVRLHDAFSSRSLRSPW